MKKKNRPEMQAAYQHCEKSDFKPEAIKTPENGPCSREISRPSEQSISHENDVLKFSAHRLNDHILPTLPLPLSDIACYRSPVAAKSVTGRGNPCMLSATPDAMIYRVFFCVNATAQPFKAVLIRIESMVALAGQLSGWPVSDNAGISTPVSVTTPYERGNSGGDSFKLLSEFIAMMTNLTQTHPKFTWRFLAINRHDRNARPCRLSVDAATEQEARRILAPHFILSLAARLPVQEVCHAR